MHTGRCTGMSPQRLWLTTGVNVLKTLQIIQRIYSMRSFAGLSSAISNNRPLAAPSHHITSHHITSHHITSHEHDQHHRSASSSSPSSSSSSAVAAAAPANSTGSFIYLVIAVVFWLKTLRTQNTKRSIPSPVLEPSPG